MDSGWCSKRDVIWRLPIPMAQHLKLSGTGRGARCGDQPQWSPNSQEIVFWTGDNSFQEIMLISLDDEINRTLTAANFGCNGNYGGVAFNPTGTHIAFDDSDCNTWLLNIENPDDLAALEEFPYWWTRQFNPQWGSETTQVAD